MADGRKYTDDDVRAIMDRALGNQPRGDLSHEELVAVASEIGVSRETVERAALEVQELRGVEGAKQRVVQRRRRHFASHLWAFLVVNAVLFAVNLLTTPGEWWVLFPIVLWGLVLAFHARFALSQHVSDSTLRREQARSPTASGTRRTGQVRVAAVGRDDSSAAPEPLSDEVTLDPAPARRVHGTE